MMTLMKKNFSEQIKKPFKVNQMMPALMIILILD